MKKLHPFAFYALVTPAIALGAAPLLAQQSTDQDMDHEQQSTQRDRDAMQSTPTTSRSEQDTQGAMQPDSQTAADRRNTRDESATQNRGYLKAAPTNGMRASDLIGADVRTTRDDDVGSVNDLILDENGQVVAIVVGVGGFLGMGEKNVAIAWDAVTESGDSDNPELGSGTPQLRIDTTREDLSAAPEFETSE